MSRALLVALWVMGPAAAHADDGPGLAEGTLSGASTATVARPTRASTTAAPRVVMGSAPEPRRSAIVPGSGGRDPIVAVELLADARATLGVHAQRLPDARGVGGSPVRAICVAPCTGTFRPGRWAVSLSRPGGALADPTVVDIGPSTGAIDLKLVDRRPYRRLGVGLAAVSGLTAIGVPLALRFSGNTSGSELGPLIVGGLVGIVAGIWLAELDDGVEANVRERPDRAE